MTSTLKTVADLPQFRVFKLNLPIEIWLAGIHRLRTSIKLLGLIVLDVWYEKNLDQPLRISVLTFVAMVFIRSFTQQSNEAKQFLCI